MTARVLDRETLIARLEWQIKVAAERPSNYDGRVTVNATDLRKLIAEVRRAEDDATQRRLFSPLIEAGATS